MLPLQVSVDLGVVAIKEYSAFPKAHALLKPHHQIALCHITRTLVGGVLHLGRDPVGVFCSPSHWATGHSLGESYTSAKIQSVYSAAPVTGPQDTRLGSHTPLHRYRLYSIATADWAIIALSLNVKLLFDP